MAKSTLYNFDYASPTSVSREEYENVGAGDLILGDVQRGFKGGTDFEIWTAAVAGTQLTEGVDYELINEDSAYSALAGYEVYTGYKITNATYQSGSIFVTYKIVGSYIDADTINDLLDRMYDAETDIAGYSLHDPTLMRSIISNNTTDSDHDLDIAAGYEIDSTGTYRMGGDAMTKRFDASWAAGDGNGGLMSGSIAADTWYSLYKIRNDTDGSIDYGADTYANGVTNLPTGYSYYRRIGYFMTDGSANITPFIQKWNRFEIAPLNMVTVTNPGTSAVLAAVFCPPSEIALLGIAQWQASSTTIYTLVTSPFVADTVPVRGNNDLDSYANVSTTNIERIVNTSSQVRYRLSASNAATHFYINSYGWIDTGI